MPAIDGLADAAYLLVAAVAIAAGSSRFDRGPVRRRRRTIARRFWLGVAILLLLAVIERQAGMLDAAVERLRGLAHADGWYGDRRLYQVEFIVAVAILGIGGGAALRAAIGRAGLPIGVAAAAITALVTFLLIQGVSLHQVDALVRHDVGGLSAGAVAQVIALGTIALAGLAERRAIGRRRPSDAGNEAAPAASSKSIEETGGSRR